MLFVAWRLAGYRISLGVRFALSVLSLFALTLTGVGLIASAALKNSHLADKVLSYNPRFKTAMDGLHVLENLNQPLREAPDKSINVSVLTIEDASWSVILDFIQSEIAIRKSERNDIPQPKSTETPKSNDDNKKDENKTESAPQKLDQIKSMPIDFYRIKAIVGLRQDVISAGPKALVPPFSLTVIWPNIPPYVGHRVYEFQSFDEFRLDLRRMILEETEALALWLAVIAFAISLPIEGLRRVIGFATADHRRKHHTVQATAAQ